MSENKMGTRPIPKLIITMAIPVIFSMMVQAFYNVVDSYYVAKVSQDSLTAVTLAFPIQMIVIASFVGLGTGINSAISRKLGERDEHSAVMVAEHGVFIGLILYVIIAVIGFFLNRSFFGIFTDTPDIIEGSIQYIRIITMVSIGAIMTQTGMNVLRGTGDMIRPMLAQLLGAVVNILLDPIFIFGKFGLPALGIRGAAIATVTAQLLSMVFIWTLIFKGGNNVLKIKLKGFRFDPRIIKEIVTVGVPSFIMQGLASIMLLGMNLILSVYGDAAVTVMGIYFRMQSMVFMPVFGLSIGTLPVVGYNYGAQNVDRLKKAVRFSATVAFLFMTTCFLVFQFKAPQLVQIFSPSANLLDLGITAFRTISFMFPFVSISIIISTSFQGIGKAYYSMIVSIIRQLVVLLPSAYLLSKYTSLDKVWFAFVIAEVIGMIVAVTLWMKVPKHAQQHHIR